MAILYLIKRELKVCIEFFITPSTNFKKVVCEIFITSRPPVRFYAGCCEVFVTVFWSHHKDSVGVKALGINRIL